MQFKSFLLVFYMVFFCLPALGMEQPMELQHEGPAKDSSQDFPAITAQMGSHKNLTNDEIEIQIKEAISHTALIREIKIGKDYLPTLFNTKLKLIFDRKAKNKKLKKTAESEFCNALFKILFPRFFNRVSCKFCDHYAFTHENLKAHIVGYHTNEELKCPFKKCTTLICSYQHLISHMSKGHPSAIHGINKPHCRQVFDAILIRYLFEKLPELNSSLLSDEENTITLEPELKSPLLSDKENTITLESEDSYQDISTFDCTFCDKSVSFSSLTDFTDHIFGSHISPTTKEILLCPKTFNGCPYNTASFNALIEHITLSHKDNPQFLVATAQKQFDKTIIKFLKSQEDTVEHLAD